MSISGILGFSGLLAVAATLPATQPAGPAGGEEAPTAAIFIITGVLSAITLAVAGWLGLLRPGSIDGPVRLDRRRPVWPLVLVWGIGTGVWLGSMTVLQAVILVVRHPEVFGRGGQPPQPIQASQVALMFTPGDWALFATAPFALGFLCLLVGDLIWNRSAVSWLGFGWAKMPKGALKGAGATLIILPWMFLVMFAAQWLYERIGYQHEREHVLLRVMKAASPAEKWALILGATVAAPFFEEFLFRGHLQTLLRQTFIRLTHRRDAPPPGAVPAGMPGMPGPWPPAGGPYPRFIGPPGAYDPALYPPQVYYPPAAPAAGVAYPPPVPPAVGAGAPLPYLAPGVPMGSPPAEEGPRRPYVWQTWLAVFLTSIAFMLVHGEPWMFPPIFCLSLCLGYVYERTGKLWASIAMHALFNTTSTVLFLLSQQGR